MGNVKVLKFGGTSVGSVDSLKSVVKIVQQANQNSTVIAVVSALGGITNQLVSSSDLALKGDDSYKNILLEIENRHFDVIRQLIDINEQSSLIATIKVLLNQLEDILIGVSLVQELSPKTSDFILSFGELLSSVIISKLLNCNWLDSREVIVTDSNYGNANVDFEISNPKIKQYVQQSTQNLFVAPGFISKTKDGYPSTLGRGGSDYTAAIFAAALDASILEIWTDVNGIMTANPKQVEAAFSVPKVSYKEAMELSHFGAKVIYPPTVLPVFKKNIPVVIKNTFDPEAQGTLISNDADDSGMGVKGISSIDKITLISLSGSGMIGIPGISSRLFGALSIAQVNIILITQASSEYSITFAISPNDVDKAVEAVNKEFEFEILSGKVNPVQVELNKSIVALVGEKMSGQVNVAGKMFSALGVNGINVRAIAQGSSERNISVVIDEKDVKKALNVLHERHFEKDHKRVNLFVVGVGNVGATLVDQIKEQQKSLEENVKVEIRIVGLCNSRKMLIQENGIDLQDWKNLLENAGQNFDKDQLIDVIKELNLRNSVLVDCTANYDVAKIYKAALSANISVVTANKIAASSNFAEYKELKKIALKNGAQFLFETNVGAGLPVIKTINDLVHSGDKIKRIEATVSGSLNFIYNNYNGSNTFHDVVKEAQRLGYTEPDPRIDLSGVDVKRKILILVREGGYQMEMDDVLVKDILPKSCFEVESVDDFFGELVKYEETFAAQLKQAQSENRKLRVVAVFDGAQASVELQAVDAQHPFYSLQGTDNVVAIYTDRYAKQPMVIQGAGAGAAVTAAGVFADIIRVVN